MFFKFTAYSLSDKLSKIKYYWFIFFIIILSCGACKKTSKKSASSFFSNKSLYIYGDSYTSGTGASSTDHRWSTLVAEKLGAEEENFGIAGSTLEKRSPINYQGAVNLIDRLSTVPIKNKSMSMAIIALGLNDVGQNGLNYTAANFITDYHVVIDTFLSRGWKANQILIMSPYYIGSAGYIKYASITGNSAPTRAHHLAFIEAAKNVSNFYGTQYLDIFSDQLKNDTTLITEDGIHPTDAGHEFIANDVVTYLQLHSCSSKKN